MKAIITVGISASGKSTWAEEFCKTQDNWFNINRDETRFKLFTNGDRDWTKYKFSKQNEKMVTEYNDELLKKASLEEWNVVISDTSLNPKIRNNLIEKLECLGYDVEIKEFPISFEEAVKRDNNRKGGVGKDIIYTQYQNWLKYKGRKTYKPDLSKPKAILVDIDGTVAKMDERSPFDWSKVGEDLPNKHVVDLVNRYTYRSDTHLIFMSGRDECCRKQTTEWLKDNFPFDFKLFMRSQDSFEKDTKVKEDLFWENVADNYNVLFAIDDRPCIIRLWRELGIETICVSNPYIEF